MVDDIEKVVITTYESAIRNISKEGLANPADRDLAAVRRSALNLGGTEC